MYVHARLALPRLTASKLAAVWIAITLLFGLIPPYSIVQADEYIVNECDNGSDAWLFCDTFETNKLSQYYDFYSRWGRFLRNNQGLDGSMSLTSYFGFYPGDMQNNQPYPIHGTRLKLAVGKTPDNSVYKPAGDPDVAERELYFRFYMRNHTLMTGEAAISNGPLARVYGYGADDVPIMSIEIEHPNAAGTLVSKLSTGQFDSEGVPTGTAVAAELTGSTPIMRADYADAWRLVEIHAKLNDPGQANGVYELWIDGQLESSKADLNWVGSYADYGINAVELYNANNDPDGPAGSDDEYRAFDNLIVSREPIGAPVENSLRNANLANIAKSDGKLTPHFQTGVTSYTLTVDHGVAAAEITPVIANDGATLKANGATLEAGTPVAITDEVLLEVTSEDGTTTKTYTVTLAQAKPVLVDECEANKTDWLFCDDFEQDRMNQYFERTNRDQFYRTGDVGLGGSSGMKAEFRQADGEQYDTGAIKVAIGRTPDAYLRSVAAQNEDLKEVYFRFYIKHEKDWTGGGGDKLARLTSIQSPAWAQAMTANVWSGTNSGRNLLISEPVRGTDAEGNLKSTKWNDFENNFYFGGQASSTPIFDEDHVGSWYAVETRVKVNDPGQANGIFQVWIDDKLEMSRTDLNWIGSYDGYGLNWVSLENYWNNGTPRDQERYFDNFVISRSKIGLAVEETAPSSPAGSLVIDDEAKQAGDAVELTIGADDATPFTAADVIVNYDPQKLEFETEISGNATVLAPSAIESLLPDFASANAVLEEQGKIRVIMTTAEEDHAASGDLPLFKLTGRVKEGAPAGDTTISLTEFQTAISGNGTLLDVSGASVTVQVVIVDKSVLSDRIAAAQQTHQAANPGSQPGEYPAGAITAFGDAIAAAIAVRDNQAATQAGVNSAILALEEATAAFEASVNVAEPADFSALQALVVKAKSKRDASSAGTKLGQYPQSAKTAFSTAIGTAESVLGNLAGSQGSVDQAVATLAEAMATFGSTIVTLIPGATQISINDLSLVSRYFGATEEDDNWSDIMIADLIDPGEITIDDIAAIARMILNEWAGIKYEYSSQQNNTSSGVIVDYDFASGDNWIDKDGWDWSGGARTVELASGVSERGAKYHYPGGDDPFGSGLLGPEQYFSMPELSEFWLKRRIWIPENYHHRKHLRLTLSNATGWEVGDVVQGANVDTHGVIKYKSGNQIALENATFPEYSALWNTTVTNLTKSLTTTGSNRQMQTDNNKFMVFYSDGYSSAGQSPTAVFQLWANKYPGNIEGNGSNLQLQIAVDGYGSGQRPNTNMEAVPFLTGDDVGMWIDVVFYMKMATNATTYDGTAIVWLRKEGETGYTKMLDKRDLNMGERSGAGAFRNGYIWGWANSGYEDPTTFYESRLTLSEASIDGLAP